MPQAATTTSLPRAFRMMKAMQAHGIEWDDALRVAAGAALKDILEGQMAGGIDRHLAEMESRGAADRRNGSYQRWPMTELGEIELSVPRSRTFSALVVVRANARRAAHIDRLILPRCSMRRSPPSTLAAPALWTRIEEVSSICDLYFQIRIL